MNWNDLKVFLAVARSGSVREATNLHQTSVSTIIRRIDTLEEQLGVRLFVRRPEGYTLTESGHDIYEDVVRLEQQAVSIEQRAQSKDASLSGTVRVTLPDCVFSYLLAGPFKKFRETYTDINIQIITTYDLLDVLKGDADIALRATTAPPEQLIGRKLPTFYSSYYASHDYVQQYDLNNPKSGAVWLGKDGSQRHTESIKKGPYPSLPMMWEIRSFPTLVSACQNGLGMAIMPCFIGDQEEKLTRVGPLPPFHMMETWLLIHPQLKDVKRVRIVIDFLVETICSHTELVQGQKPKLRTL